MQVLVTVCLPSLQGAHSGLQLQRFVDVLNTADNQLSFVLVSQVVQQFAV